MNRLIRSLYYSMLLMKARPKRTKDLFNSWMHWSWKSPYVDHSATYAQNLFLDKYWVKK